MDHSRHLIVGTGAMACLFAARMAQAGLQPQMLGSWTAALEVLRTSGVRLRMNGGKWESFPVRVYERCDDLPPISLAIVLVKAWQTAEKGRMLQHCLAPDGIALTLQNGLGNREDLAAILGKERVMAGSITLGAKLVQPGVVEIETSGTVILPRTEYTADISAFMRTLGFDVETHADIETLLWQKVAINAAINPLTALLEISNGELLHNPHAGALLRAIVSEVSRVAQAQNMELPPEKLIEAAEAVALQTAQNTSSMLQDVRRGARSEVDWINGAVVRAGRRCGIDTPVNEIMLQLIHAKVESGNRVEM